MSLPPALFFVTSAVHTAHGVFDADERFSQTLATVHSVQRHWPGANIVWMEMAPKPLTPQQTRQLIDLNVHLLDASGDPEVQTIARQATNHDVLKTATELRGMGLAMAHARAQGWFKGMDRVFKISGRYTLNDAFSAETHCHYALRGRYVFALARASQYPSELTGGLTMQFMSRLWSAGADLLPTLPDLFERMNAAFYERLNAGGFVDIEHLLHHFCAPQAVGLYMIGVSGQLGPNGYLISD